MGTRMHHFCANFSLFLMFAFRSGGQDSRGVHTCLPTESVRTVLRRLVEKQVSL